MRDARVHVMLQVIKMIERYDSDKTTAKESGLMQLVRSFCVMRQI